MISVQNLRIYLSDEPLFKEVSFVVADKDRIGLVGKNGAGKTTLLKILSGQLYAENGNIVITKGHRIGYLPQEMNVVSNKNVWEETYTAFAEVKQIEEQINKINRRLAQYEDYE